MAISTDDRSGLGRPTVERIDEGRSLDGGAVFEALVHEHRRYVLYYLHERGTVPGEELVDAVAAAAGAADAEDRRRVAAGLRDEHLPALLDAGLVYLRPAGRHRLARVPPAVRLRLAGPGPAGRRSALTAAGRR